MKRFNNTIGGFLCGFLLPVLFIWIYLYVFHPGGNDPISLNSLWGTPLLGKLLLLSLTPDLILTFVFYKRDNFRFGSGVIVGMFPLLILSMMMM